MWEFLQNGTELMFQFSGGSGYTHGGTLVANTWSHVATSRSGSTITNYINGASVGTSTYSGSGTYYSTSTFRVGTDRLTTNFINGSIDDLRITKGIARYTANFTPPTAPLPTSGGY